jgi:hypothetical protein
MKPGLLESASKADLDLSFPPPFSEQAKYLEIADKFLSLTRTPHREKLLHVDSSRHSAGSKTKKVA